MDLLWTNLSCYHSFFYLIFLQFTFHPPSDEFRFLFFATVVILTPAVSQPIKETFDRRGKHANLTQLECKLACRMQACYE